MIWLETASRQDLAGDSTRTKDLARNSQSPLCRLLSFRPPPEHICDCRHTPVRVRMYKNVMKYSIFHRRMWCLLTFTGECRHSLILVFHVSPNCLSGEYASLVSSSIFAIGIPSSRDDAQQERPGNIGTS
ncbi:hypothetical protein NPIL_346991 [Nephila pilipes]|uniref:Uncharacterized protein n=1 Tax=Nephila pilipes TaxID=299642 RepID=A0A8X6NYV0_NEPPI|nr:hypothetical protein NPIL_346991 [Nephila pilipes]